MDQAWLTRRADPLPPGLRPSWPLRPVVGSFVDFLPAALAQWRTASARGTFIATDCILSAEPMPMQIALLDLDAERGGNAIYRFGRAKRAAAA